MSHLKNYKTICILLIVVKLQVVGFAVVVVVIAKFFFSFFPKDFKLANQLEVSWVGLALYSMPGHTDIL